MSSGVLSAISSFSEEARSSAVESFSSETELFLFSKIKPLGANFIGVFTKNTDQIIAELIVENIKAEMISQKLLVDGDLIYMDTDEKVSFKKQIPEIIRRIQDSEEQEAFLNRLFSEIDGAMLGMFIDVTTKNKLWSAAKPRPLFKDDYVQDYLLLHSVTNNMISRLGLGDNYIMINIESADYRTSSLFNGTHVALVTSSVIGNFAKLQSKVADMSFYPRYADIESVVSEFENITQFALENNTLTKQQGMDLPTNAAIFIQTFMNNLQKFFRNITNRLPSTCEIYFSRNKSLSGKMIIKMDNSNSISDFEVIN